MSRGWRWVHYPRGRISVPRIAVWCRRDRLRAEAATGPMQSELPGYGARHLTLTTTVSALRPLTALKTSRSLN